MTDANIVPIINLILNSIIVLTLIWLISTRKN